MGSLAELTEQKHETSHGAGGDMCEGTTARRADVACSRPDVRPAAKAAKKHGQKTTKKTMDRKTLGKNHGQKTAFKKR